MGKVVSILVFRSDPVFGLPFSGRPPMRSGVVTGPGASRSSLLGGTANDVSGNFNLVAGSPVVVTVTATNSAGRSLGVQCGSEEHHEANTVGTHTFVVASGGTGFIFVWYGSAYEPGVTESGLFTYQAPLPPLPVR